MKTVPVLRLGVDLGGTKIEIIALDQEGKECFRQRLATPQGDYVGTLTAVADLVANAENILGAKGSIGIGTPGALSPATGLLRNSNSVCLNGKPFKQDLEECLQREVRMANDANCFALSEAVDGAAADASVVFGVIVGTGVGAGIVVNRSVLTGPNAIAGEWGHNPLPWPKESERDCNECYCGQNSCIETWLSGPALSQDHVWITGESMSAEAIVQQAAAGGHACDISLQRYEERMARALAHVINMLDPDVIVLGGGMSNIGRLYENVPKLWDNYVFSDVVNTRLLPPVHGDSGGVRGAAWLW